MNYINLSLETFVFGEILKSYCSLGKVPSLYYYRDINKIEIDILMTGAGKIYPIEIKNAKTPSVSSRNFSVPDKFGMEIMPGIIICMTDELFPVNRHM